MRCPIVCTDFIVSSLFWLLFSLKLNENIFAAHKRVIVNGCRRLFNPFNIVRACMLVGSIHVTVTDRERQRSRIGKNHVQSNKIKKNEKERND